jgi:hypothetical protein
MAVSIIPKRRDGGGCGHILVIPEKGVLLLADLDGVTTELEPSAYHCLFQSIHIGGRVTYLGDEDLVTGSDTHGETLALLVEETRANSEDLGLVLLLDGSLGEEDTGGRLGLRLDALDQDAVQEGGERLDVAEDRLKGDELVIARLDSARKREFGYIGLGLTE